MEETAKQEKAELSEQDKVNRDYTWVCSQIGALVEEKDTIDLQIANHKKELQALKKKAADMAAAREQFKKEETLQ